MTFRITAAHEEDAFLEFEIPREDGSSLDFKVPKLQFIPRPTADKYKKWIEERLKDEDNPLTELDSLYKLFDLLIPKLASDLKKLTDGELLQINKYWVSESTVTVGESSASEG